jgi:hypothetical protein
MKIENELVTIPVVVQFSMQLRQKPKSPNMRDGIMHPVTYQCDVEEGNFTKQSPNFMDSLAKPNFPVTF